MNWDEYVRQTFHDFIDNELTIAEYLAKMPKGVEILNHEINSMLCQALESQDAEKAESLCIAIAHGKPTSIFTEALVKLLESDWVYFKESIIELLGEIGDCNAARTLFQIIDQPVEGSYYGSHKIKSVWALGSLQNCEVADLYLSRLAESDDSAIRENALHELIRRRINSHQ